MNFAPSVAGGRLAAHGFVLAGGKSTRMGKDKATIQCGRRPMVEITLEKLRAVCAQVSIAGNREDLAVYAPVVCERRFDAGPAAGLEAGLMAAQSDWAMFLPVDLPLIPVELLRRWARQVLEMPLLRASYLRCGENIHPALCLLHRECLPLLTAALNAEDRKLSRIFAGMGELLWVPDAREFAPAGMDTSTGLVNVNTPQDLAEANAILEQESLRG